MKVFRLLVLIFFATAILQLYLWTTFPYVDEAHWVRDSEKIASGIALTPLDVTYVHPGTTIVFPAAVLVFFGVASEIAVPAVLSFLIALCVALSGVLAYLIRPQYLWWLALVLILAGDIRFLHVTPPTALVSVLVVLYFLLLIQKRETHVFDTKADIFLGLCLGMLCATRVDTGIFVLLTSLPLLYATDWRRWMIAPLLGLSVFSVLNVHLWTDPVSHVASILNQISGNTGILESPGFMFFLATFPFTMLSIFASLFFMFNRSEYLFPRDVYVWLLGGTALLTCLLAFSTFHPVRYFMPLYVVWDVLLPLWICMSSVWIASTMNLSWLTSKRVEYAVVGILLAKIPVVFVLLSFY